jgi:hypothetical protein
VLKDTTKISASSYIQGLIQEGPTVNGSINIGAQTLGANGNRTYTVSVAAPVDNCFALGRIKFDGLTSPNPTDVGIVWYPVEGTFSLLVRGAGTTDNFWLEGYMSRSGRIYTFNFEIANNSPSAAVGVPGFTLRLAADFYSYPF